MRSHGINARQVLEEINLHALCFVNKFTCGSNLLPTLHFPECSDLCIYLALLNYMPLIQLLYFFCSVALSYPTLCNPLDYSPLGSSVHGISQVGILECVAIPFSRGSSQPRDLTCISCISYVAGGFFTAGLLLAQDKGTAEGIQRNSYKLGYKQLIHQGL